MPLSHGGLRPECSLPQMPDGHGSSDAAGRPLPVKRPASAGLTASFKREEAMIHET